MESLAAWVERALGVSSETVGKLVLTLAIAVALTTLRMIWVRLVYHRTDRPDLRYRWRKGSAYGVTVIGLVLIGRVWLEGIQSLVTYFGLLSAGVAVALRDPIVNAIGWAYIGWRRPFGVGDRVRVGDLNGDVIDIGISTFSLLEVSSRDQGEQPTGRIVHVPNGKVFVEPVSNITQGFSYVWNEIPIVVTFESNWQRAKSILLHVAREEVGSAADEAQRWIRDATKRFLIRPPDASPAVYTRIVSDGVELTVRYVCEARHRRTTEETIAEAILKAFAGESAIDLAYRTSRLFRNSEEGKPALRSSASCGEDTVR
ncbi:MAG: mechanosensitive ion channel domain-containing protein [Candidatus Bipolaricaulota bacterium]